MGSDFPPPGGADPTRPPAPPTEQQPDPELRSALGEQAPPAPPEHSAYAQPSEYQPYAPPPGQSAYAQPSAYQAYQPPTDYRATGRYQAPGSAYAPPQSFQPAPGYQAYQPGQTFPPSPGMAQPGTGQSAYAPPSAYQQVTGYPGTHPYPGYPLSPMAQALPGYPPQGGPGAYRAPGPVAAASTLGYIEAGLLFLLGILTLAAGAAVGSAFDNAGTAIAVIGLIPIALGVLFILATRQLQTGKGRTFLFVLAILAALFHVISLLGDLTNRSGGGALMLGLVLLGVPIAIIVLLFQQPTSRWIEAHRGAPFPGA